MLKLTIDGKPLEAEEGTTILAAAGKARIDIPTLCYNEELSPAGSCRVCVVEVTQNGASALVTACTHPVAEGMAVSTSSERVMNARHLAVELLLAQRPHSEKLTRIAKGLRIEKPRFELPHDECILCQLCTRTCQEVVGASAITFIARGQERDNKDAKVVWDAERCIACGSCAYICPTRAVTLEDNKATRVISTPSGKMEFALQVCERCGAFYAPQKQLDHMAHVSGLPREKFNLCLDCRE